MRKLLQLKMYSFLSSRWGMTFCVVGLFVTLNTFFQIVQLLVSRESIVLVSQEYSQNVGGKSYQHVMCADPIDIVYTWVNGSDPIHKKAVAEYKRLVRDPNMKACNQTQVPDKDNCYKDEDTASRFIDNEELRYSLRSIETFAPWVRHIFLVTNGQVPSWINTEHPRLTIVTHAEIFTNKSHLPTFSSPSIEVHLHRIPGLSKKFIYLNDDVMFGREVYPDDFYTLNAGQKVFLSWAVPNCAEGCPPNWVGDGYCDLACNVSACEFDAHDCDNYTAPNNSPGITGNVDTSQRYKNYCSKGCPDSWIGDKYCDRMCKNLECAFDAGDCGVDDIFGSMFGVQITNATHTIALPSGLPSVYFNLTEIVGGATITDGSHDNVELVRTATISQKFKIMTLTFHRNISLQEVMLSITAENTTESGNKTIIEKSFNITLDTIVHPSNETLSGESNTTNPIPLPEGPITNLTSPELIPHSANSSGVRSDAQPNDSTVVSLEPAPQPPKDAAIEANIKSGAGGLPDQVPVERRLDASPDENVGPAESVVPVEQQEVQSQAHEVQASAVGDPGLAAAQVVPELPRDSHPGTERNTNSTIQLRLAGDAPETAESSTIVDTPQTEALQANLDIIPGTDPKTDILGELQSEVVVEGKPEARQAPDGYDDHESDRPQPPGQSNFQPVENMEFTNRKESESDLEPPKRLADSQKPQPGDLESETTQDLHRVIGNDLEWLQEKDENSKVDTNSQTSLNGGSVPEGGANEQNLEQKFVLVSPDAGDSSGALKTSEANELAEGNEGDGAVPQHTKDSEVTENIQRLENTQDVQPYNTQQEGTQQEDTQQEGTQQEGTQQEDTDASPRAPYRGSKNDNIRFKKNERVDNADELHTRFDTNNRRNILSIPIYETVGTYDSSSADKQLLSAPTTHGNTSANYKQFFDASTTKPPSNSADYKRWWDMMTEKKKLDMQQMEQSKKELEELELKLQQNRDFDKQIAASNSTSFPWEENKRWALYETKGGGRKLLDDFADSLKHVNKLYTQTFGPSARKVPAHMPHMIDKDIMEELQSKWPNEWNATSSHRLRSGADMQYAFAYFYYLIHARVEYNLTNIWLVELDMDKDNELNDNELRTLAVHLHGAPLKSQAFDELKERLVNTCMIMQAADSNRKQHSSQAYTADEDIEGSGSTATVHCPITLDVLSNDNKTSEEIKKVFSKKLKYRHQIEGTDEVAFLMIGNNDTVVQGKLDGIRSKRQKFICLNDNMNHSSPDTPAVVKVLHDLYTALVPLPSSFELPPNVRNAYLYIDEINAAKAMAKRARQYEMAVGIGAIVLILVVVYRCRVYASKADRRVRERRAKRLLNSGGIS